VIAGEGGVKQREPVQGERHVQLIELDEMLKEQYPRFAQGEGAQGSTIAVEEGMWMAVEDDDETAAVEDEDEDDGSIGDAVPVEEEEEYWTSAVDDEEDEEYWTSAVDDEEEDEESIVDDDEK